MNRLQAVDPERKIVLAPGSFFSAGRNALASDTAQRQNALDLASTGADWVLQLDSDELAADPAEFLSCLQQADGEGFDAVDYPARYLYQHVRNGWYLERCRRLWRPAAAYPGASPCGPAPGCAWPARPMPPCSGLTSHDPTPTPGIPRRHPCIEWCAPRRPSCT